MQTPDAAHQHSTAPHVVIFPYDEHGHVTPAFALGRSLASKGILVTGVLTASRHAHGPRPPASPVDLFHILTIPDDSSAVDDDGPKQHDDLCYQHSLQKLEPGLEELMLRLQPPPSCLISDILYPWSQDLADRLRIPRYQFWPFSATACLMLLHLPDLCAKALLPFQPGTEDERLDFIPGLPKSFRLRDVCVDFLSRDPDQLAVLFNMLKGIERAAGALFNTVYDLESTVANALAGAEYAFPTVYTLGPMSSLEEAAAAGHGNGDLSRHPASNVVAVHEDDCLQWLDAQPHASVVYVALGSMVGALTEEETEEMAWGLEACGKPFLWVLPRVKQGNADIDGLISALPAGFLSRGHVVAWAPQTAVLAHPSVGCYITHCGVSSLQEAMLAGVPVIAGFCKISDQNTNFRLMTQEWGGGIALMPEREEASPRPALRSRIERCVKEVIHGEKGRALSSNALKLKATLSEAVAAPRGSSYLSLVNLAEALITSAHKVKAEQIGREIVARSS